MILVRGSTSLSHRTQERGDWDDRIEDFSLFQDGQSMVCVVVYYDMVIFSLPPVFERENGGLFSVDR